MHYLPMTVSVPMGLSTGGMNWNSHWKVVWFISSSEEYTVNTVSIPLVTNGDSKLELLLILPLENDFPLILQTGIIRTLKLYPQVMLTSSPTHTILSCGGLVITRPVNKCFWVRMNIIIQFVLLTLLFRVVYCDQQ